VECGRLIVARGAPQIRENALEVGMAPRPCDEGFVSGDAGCLERDGPRCGLGRGQGRLNVPGMIIGRHGDRLGEHASDFADFAGMHAAWY
jgi:hypothetical protein